MKDQGWTRDIERLAKKYMILLICLGILALIFFKLYVYFHCQHHHLSILHSDLKSEHVSARDTNTSRMRRLRACQKVEPRVWESVCDLVIDNIK